MEKLAELQQTVIVPRNALLAEQATECRMGNGCNPAAAAAAGNLAAAMLLRPLAGAGWGEASRVVKLSF